MPNAPFWLVLSRIQGQPSEGPKRPDRWATLIDGSVGNGPAGAFDCYRARL